MATPAEQESDHRRDEQVSTRRPIGRGLLPREDNFLTELPHLTTSYFWGIANSWHSLFGIYGASNPDDAKVRALVSLTSPPIMLLELNSVATFNMMDPVIATDFDMMMDTYLLLARRSRRSNQVPLGAVVQGAGPHFCPGGNHHPVDPPGATPWTMSARATSSVAFVRVKEIAIPSTTAMTGSCIGGGVALSLQSSTRVATSNTSMAFGNISRGACPIMWLSKNLPTTVGMSAALEIYLTDATISAYAALKGGMVSGVCPNFALTKNRAYLAARRMASTPATRLCSMIQPLLNQMRFSDEGYGMTRCGLTGQLFANIMPGETAELPVRTKLAKARLPPGHSGINATEDGAETGEEGDAESLASARRRRKLGKKEPLPRVVRETVAPQPFPVTTSGDATPVALKKAPTRCTQCGTPDADGYVYGKAFYCQTCWNTWPSTGYEDSTTVIDTDHTIVDSDAVVGSDWET